MKIVFLCGSHPRHMYIANKLYQAGHLAGLVVENRGQMIPVPPENLKEIDRVNFIRHFADRDSAEEKFFGNIDGNKVQGVVPTLKVEMETLSAEETIQFLRHIEPDMIISYGVHKIEPAVLDMFPDRAFNMHGGLSPWFKGNITLFWPFYFLRPNWAGMTIHYLSDRIDAGEIVHHALPTLEYGDGLHDVACKAVMQGAEDICKILDKLDRKESLPRVSQGRVGKLFVGTDWEPQHLRLVYNTFNNDIVDRYLDGEIQSSPPRIVNALE